MKRYYYLFFIVFSFFIFGFKVNALELNTDNIYENVMTSCSSLKSYDFKSLIDVNSKLEELPNSKILVTCSNLTFNVFVIPDTVSFVSAGPGYFFFYNSSLEQITVNYHVFQYYVDNFHLATNFPYTQKYLYSIVRYIRASDSTEQTYNLTYSLQNKTTYYSFQYGFSVPFYSEIPFYSSSEISYKDIVWEEGSSHSGYYIIFADKEVVPPDVTLGLDFFKNNFNDYVNYLNYSVSNVFDVDRPLFYLVVSVIVSVVIVSLIIKLLKGW